MRCLSCNKNMNDREANRKYLNHQEIKNPEDKYIHLCDGCLSESDLAFDEPNNLPEIDYDLDGDSAE